MGVAKSLKSSRIQKVPRKPLKELGLRALVDACDHAIIGTDANGIIVSWNKGAEKICGYKAEEALGRSISILIPPDHPDELPEIMTRLRRGEHIATFETTRIHKDGHPIDLSISISPVIGRGDVVVGASVVAHDITQHKATQNALIDLRALVDASDDAIIGKTADGTIVSWNTGAEKVYGYKSEEALGRSISILIPPDHPDELPEIMTRLRRGEHIATFETTRIHKDGHPIDVSVTISPVKGRGGVVVGATAVARDITKQKETEEALRISEERFRVALRSAPVVVFSHDLQLRYTWMSSPNFPVRPENYLGRTDTEVFEGEEGACLTAIKEEVLRTGVESHTEVTVTLQCSGSA
jgi:PAS domain S-box-containing protein